MTCAPAQFEERFYSRNLVTEMPDSGDEYTVYRPPRVFRLRKCQSRQRCTHFWMTSTVPSHEFSKDVYAFLQMHALFSWELPTNWQIVLTANPEGGDYDVNEMDDAMLTRMLHITMRFDAECWAKWAINKVWTITWNRVLAHISTNCERYSYNGRSFTGH